MFRYGRDQDITLGDLHGNAMKLVYFLIQHGGMLLQKKSDYLILFQSYQIFKNNVDDAEREVLKHAITQFEAILSHVTFRSGAPFIRLIGDVLADRGYNDYLTLLVFRALKNNHIRYEIIFSNHDQVALAMFDEDMDLTQAFISGQQMSLDNMRALFLLNIIDQAKTYELFDEVYRPYLRLTGGTHQVDSETLYTHAPINRKVLEDLTSTFDVEYDDRSKQAFIKSMEATNAEASKEIQNKQLTGTYRTDYNCYGDDSSLYQLIWNRDPNKSMEPEGAFQILNVHGHVGPYFEMNANAINLDDNCFGKSEEYQKGMYCIYLDYDVSELRLLGDLKHTCQDYLSHVFKLDKTLSMEKKAVIEQMLICIQNDEHADFHEVIL